MLTETYWVDKDEMWPAYIFKSDGEKSSYMTKYQLPKDLVEEYVRVSNRLEDIKDELLAYAQATEQVNHRSTTL